MDYISEIPEGFSKGLCLHPVRVLLSELAKKIFKTG
jgi:hypothetical protein